LSVKVYVNNGDVEAALRKFKKAVDRDGVLRDMRNREYFEKPSEKRKREKNRKLKNIAKYQEEGESIF